MFSSEKTFVVNNIDLPNTKAKAATGGCSIYSNITVTTHVFIGHVMVQDANKNTALWRVWYCSLGF